MLNNFNRKYLLYGILLLLELVAVSVCIEDPLINDDPFFELMHEELFKSKRNNEYGYDSFGEKLPPILPPEKVNDDNKSLLDNSEVPSYVIDFCPLVHLHTEEEYWPSDIADYVKNFNLTDATGNIILGGTSENPLSLKDLKAYYKLKHKNKKSKKDKFISSSSVVMTSIDDFDKDPDWLIGHRPKFGTGYIKKGPAVLVVVDKGNGWVDAFWFYFYPFNWGPYVMGGGPWGNHVGDWEHSLVRFYKGEPKYLWMSAHSGGVAYRYSAIEKMKKLRRVNGKLTPEVIERPLIFAARGTHANYASVGQHAHDVPFFFMPLSDFTDRGLMWDPSLNLYSYIQIGTTITPANDKSKKVGTDWLYFAGKWGDKELPRSDPRQKWSVFQMKYINGPTGPLFKHLDRISLCPSFKWWNFLNSCPQRRFIKKSNGLNAEKNDLIGDNCGVLLYKIRPKWLRGIFRLIMWRGVICFIMEFFTG
ncbi:hypothetical protein TPHA_0A05740 [Tetrapisispora phaffii CBS 4417]|uniref:Vacuolar protein sorting-associated protein 62 n=1 Tax=Tetrapisispora phaffii (strain ATCC 24235 / CBS 4417 / NBRC 1672 / NRRL Y-8282 / UCD 70-5) TaxID=1071381 RepID=G8BP20_TETPH|nr:hypothetical protein TPHA_0A05740 [Tetrapisispora phaffii CBS 4417]CCE61648.1 hypothetical protein TPHA_0A05740 [Tetrapisispora phaffii CBS 4417]